MITDKITLACINISIFSLCRKPIKMYYVLLLPVLFYIFYIFFSSLQFYTIFSEHQTMECCAVKGEFRNINPPVVLTALDFLEIL